MTIKNKNGLICIYFKTKKRHQSLPRAIDDILYYKKNFSLFKLENHATNKINTQNRILIPTLIALISQIISI